MTVCRKGESALPTNALAKGERRERNREWASRVLARVLHAMQDGIARQAAVELQG